MKRNRILYLTLLATTIALAAVLEWHTLSHGPLSGYLCMTPVAEYAVNYALVAVSLLTAFLAIRYKRMCTLARMCMVSVVACLDIVYYFVNFDPNVLWCLPMLLVAYLFVWPKDEE